MNKIRAWMIRVVTFTLSIMASPDLRYFRDISDDMDMVLIAD